MRKIRKFNLNQNRFLSAEEMAELNGGATPLIENCTEKDVDKKCIYTGPNDQKFEGTCKYVYSYVAGGSSSTTTVGYACVMNP